MRTNRIHLVSIVIAALFVLGTTATAQHGYAFGMPDTMSQETGTVPGGANPGDAANKGKIVRLFNTPMSTNDGRLVVVYGDANNTANVWHPKDGVHKARDIFARFSDDDGATWSNPVNLSNTANFFSATADWDGDGALENFWGDSSKPTIFNSGNYVVVSWTDKYAPESTWTWGQLGNSTVQGRIDYADLAVYPNTREIPYSALYLAVSIDGGATWIHGGANPPLQLTYGRRDALQDVVRGAGKKWFVTWQEDPEGLQPGEGGGPGEGASGAKGSKGTDVWYAWTTDITTQSTALQSNVVPLTNHSEYDMTSLNGHATVGMAGSLENHAATRANSHIINDNGVFKTIVAYEETKGTNDVLEGKTIQYHCFPYDMPVQNGTPTQTSGDPGTRLTPILENSRRVRFVRQGPDGIKPAITIFWKQGVGTQGAPSDIMLKTSTSLDGSAVAAAPTINMSSFTPTATPANLTDATGLNPLEDARAHRAYMRGNTILVGYSYTPNQPLARFTNLENYNFWMRRSLDGGVTWLAPQNLSNITDTTIDVDEPRLVGTPNTGMQDNNALVVAWGTRTNGYEGIDTPVPLDVAVTRTTDLGATFEPLATFTSPVAADGESQLRINDDATRVFATWMEDDGFKKDMKFAAGFGARNPLNIDVFDDFAHPGGFAALKFNAPGFAFGPYQALASMSTTPGIPTPWGTIPLNADPMMAASISRPDVFFGFNGTMDATGTSYGVVVIANDPSVSGATFYTAFLVYRPTEYGISDAAQITIQ